MDLEKFGLNSINKQLDALLQKNVDLINKKFRDEIAKEGGAVKAEINGDSREIKTEGLSDGLKEKIKRYIADINPKT